jgi:hypothetical protein
VGEWAGVDDFGGKFAVDGNMLEWKEWIGRNESQMYYSRVHECLDDYLH